MDRNAIGSACTGIAAGHLYLRGRQLPFTSLRGARAARATAGRPDWKGSNTSKVDEVDGEPEMDGPTQALPSDGSTKSHTRKPRYNQR
jgi:hypothetical protein